MHSSSRNGATPRVLVVHTTEGIMRAADLRAWKAWAGSAHASCDETGALLAGAADGFVDYDRASWTLRSGNAWSENIELCGKAAWTRAQWLSRPKLLDRCAYWLAARSKARGIPLVKLTAAEYRAGKRGVIGHNEHTVGYSDGTHWDPGPHFPWDVVLAAARAYATPARPPATPPAPQRAPQIGDDMILATQLTKGATTYGLYSGGILTGLSNDGGAGKAFDAGKIYVQWVTAADWAELDRKSKILLGGAPDEPTA